MEKLYEKIDKLKEELSKTDQVRKIKELNKKVKSNQELQDKINTYHKTFDENIKKEIYQNCLFKEYKQSETELNILILEINNKLKKITNKGKCNL